MDLACFSMFFYNYHLIESLYEWCMCKSSYVPLCSRNYVLN